MWCHGHSSAIMWRICRIEKGGTPQADARPMDLLTGLRTG
jgi:hypothetical protein